MTKQFGIFFLLSSVTSIKGHFVRVQKVFWHLLWKLYDYFCNIWEVVGKHKILKEKGKPSSEGKFLAFFLVLTNMANVRQRLVRAHKVLWQVLCKICDRFFRTYEFENQTSQKKLSASWQKFGQFFLVLSSMTNLREHFLGVHEVIWLSLRK